MSVTLLRQCALIDRAVRMHALRVVLATQRAVMQEWAHVTVAARRARHVRGQVFATAFLTMHTQGLLNRAFYGWSRRVRGLHRRPGGEVAEGKL